MFFHTLRQLDEFQQFLILDVKLNGCLKTLKAAFSLRYG